MLCSPGDLLRLSPSAEGTASQDDRVEMRDRLEELACIRRQRQVPLEVTLPANRSPELRRPDFGFRLARRHAEDPDGRRVEIGQDPIAVKKKLTFHA
jgi:hypothetical protein